ncbi:MAG: ABC transporter permease subunit [Candidatus Latescibacter sp.]|nr:ABC transporter permease subunit [Candidatus Latescibacter sp.]
MISDILTVIWKEAKEYFHQRGSSRSTVLMMVVPLLVLGIVMPLQFGKAWIQSPVSLIAWTWIPLLLAVNIIADSIAGERERHTLETLLASRLSDTAILLGKLFASMLYALVMTFLIIITGIITVNLRFFGGGIIFLPVSFLAVGMLASILGTGFAVSAGILVSLRAATVRQALQTLSFGIIIISVLPTMLYTLLPSVMRKSISLWLDSVNGVHAAAVIFGFLFALDMVLVMLSMKRFKREKLAVE